MTAVQAGMMNVRAWRRFVGVCLACFFALLAFALAAIILIDPYDTGYFPSLIGPGVVDDNDVISTVGRGRDPRFDAGIFGNSHGLLLDPARLSPATGLHFVQLTTLGSGPREQLALIRYFLRRHPDAKALVVAVDRMWCTHDPALPNTLQPPEYRFPYWLFGPSRLRYLANMLNTRSFRPMRRRILLATGHLEPIDPVGVAAYPAYWDFANEPDAIRDPDVPLADRQISTDFPAIDRLAALMASLSPPVAVVVVMPPVYSGLLHGPETYQAAELAACKARLTGALAARPRSTFLDLLVDSPLSRPRDNFFDLHHMRENVARAIEPRIADAINAAP
ncbi:MAG TPA: hypothetical protein VKX28_17260 [Xanthobacteraceae bacterium]|nr:hypothetical protein [Xanthobacteraceae bacterium]